MDAKVMKEMLEVNSFTHVDICTIAEANALPYNPKTVILILDGSGARNYLLQTITVSVGQSAEISFCYTTNPLQYGGAYTFTMQRLSSGKINMGFTSNPPFVNYVRLIVFG